MTKIFIGSYEKVLFGFEFDKTFKPEFMFPAHNSPIKSISSNTKYLVTGGNDELIKIWDLKNKKEIGILDFHKGNITNIKFCKSKYFISSSEDCTISIWRIKDFQYVKVLRAHLYGIIDFDIHPSEKLAISFDKVGCMILWNLMNGQKASSLQLNQVPDKIKFNKEGNLICLIGKDFDTKIIQINDFSKILLSITHDYKTNPLCFQFLNYDSEEFLVMGHENGEISIIGPIDLNNSNFKKKVILDAHINRIKDLIIKEEILFTISSDGIVSAWDLKMIINTGEELIDKKEIILDKYQTGCRLICLN